MTAISTCPDEPELLSVAMGEPTDEAIVLHVQACEACRGRVERLQAEVSALGRDLGGGPAADPAVPDPAADPEGEPSDGPTASFSIVAARTLAKGWPEKPVAIDKYVGIDLLDWGLEGEVRGHRHRRLGDRQQGDDPGRR
jgi:hypothetical protein